MVFFTCNQCGNCLKKNQVEGHMRSCGRVVSCMDCQKEFRGNEFQAHTKCISEAEKYNGPDWKPPSSANKGEKKQMAWVETVNSVLENKKNNMTPAQIGLLKTIAKHDNVPRKKPKFLNFIRNVARTSDEYTVNAVWDCLEAEWKSQAEKNKPTKDNAVDSSKEESKTSNGDAHNGISGKQNGTQNGSSTNADLNLDSDNDNGRKKKKSKKNKRKLEEQEEDEPANKPGKKKRKGADDAEQENGFVEHNESGNVEAAVADSTTEFKWGEIIQQILETRDDKSISLKKLRKKVFSEYYSRIGDSAGVKSKEDLIVKLNKKLKKKKFKVIGEVVKLAKSE